MLAGRVGEERAERVEHAPRALDPFGSGQDRATLNSQESEDESCEPEPDAEPQRPAPT
jgi:hypothetical protein